ncbi:unnamed protein product [Cylicocyclus nassatus]|uniref:THAP-type domain-containing protein n=1 Tax=Cylicocyclus nassatus TaxID=53992 RepID=A0AA36GVX0_CYLNA|nr:unnamed protein product [Cylicocyclus nassatus]
MTRGDDVVLPSFTNIGEPTCASSEGTAPSETEPTIIYSSIPPDVNMDSMSRATKSSIVGEMLRVTKGPGGKLRIFACEPTDESSLPSVYDRGQSSSCVVCHRTIEDREMFLNFPDDLDRRRLWGNMLGFKYSDMLRLRDGSVMLSTGNICTDHFSEECFRVFNFNKAAIEALGMPSVVSPVVRLTPSKKWIPWDCTVCSFQSHSVCAMQRHMVEHTDDVLLRYHPKSPRGLLCPFCRKCTYGYKTMSGLRRHLATPPTQHCQLKRILEIARVNCRASLLEPSMKWSSWTDRNVYIAYHGCEPPPPTPRKLLTDSPVRAEVPDERSASESGSQEKNNPEKESTSPSQPALEQPISTSSACKERNQITAQITPPVTPGAPSSSSTPSSSPLARENSARPVVHQNPRRLLFLTSPIKRDANGKFKTSRAVSRPVLQLRKPLLPSDIVKTSETTSAESSSLDLRKNEDEKCRSVAKIILKATSTPHQTLADALNLMSDSQEGDTLREDPALAKPLFLDSEIPSSLTTKAFARDPRVCKTRRQLESVEARIRLFGDCSRVEVPSGYTTVETQNGVRLVEGNGSITEVPPLPIHFPRGRFLPVSHR